MATSRFNIRIVIAFLVAVVIAYWLILPRGDKQDKTNLGQSINKLEESTLSAIPLIKEDAKEDVGSPPGIQKMIKLEEELEKSQKETRQLRDMMKEKVVQVEELQHFLDAKQERNGPEAAAHKKFSGHKLVHFDLKGAAPKIGYLQKLLPFLKNSGATGLLVEYEDMYPYEGTLKV